MSASSRPDFSSLSRRSALAMLALSGFVIESAAQGSPPATPIPVEPPASADTSGVEILEVKERPSLRLFAKTTWDAGLATIGTTLKTLTAERARLGLKQAGNPVSHFLESDDVGFSFDLHVPLESELEAGKALEGGITLTPIPGGRAAVFTHEGAYDEIDAAYEAIAAWLDERKLVATGKFLEEYLTLPAQSDDPGMRLKISIFLK